jgi:nucleoside-diphosphate-sugar epimerase
MRWVPRILPKLREKLLVDPSLHLVHGDDVARATLAVIESNAEPSQVHGQRWLLSDGNVYDWRAIIQASRHRAQLGAVRAQLQSEDPPAAEVPAPIPRRLNPDEFWKTFGLQPAFPLVLEQEPEETATL